MGKGWGSGTQSNWDSQRQHKGGTKGKCAWRKCQLPLMEQPLRTEARGADMRTRPRQQGCCD